MNTNTINSNTTGDIDLASVVGLASANAEDCGEARDYCEELAHYKAQEEGWDWYLESIYFQGCFEGLGC